MFGNSTLCNRAATGPSLGGKQTKQKKNHGIWKTCLRSPRDQRLEGLAASNSVFYFMFLGQPKASIYHMCHLRCSKGGRRHPGPVRSKLPFLQTTSTLWPRTCSCGRGISTAGSFLWGKGTCIKAVGCSYFISKMHRAGTPAFFLEYFKANYMRELLRPAPCGISFVPSSKPYVT